MRLTGDTPVGRRVAVVAAVGVLSGAASVLLDWRLLVPIAFGVPLALMAVLAAWPHEGDRLSLSPQPTFHGAVHDVRWVAASLVLAATFAGVGFFDGARDASEAASGNLSRDNLLELAAMGMGTLTVLSALRQGWRHRVPPHAWLFVAYAGLTLASVLWSRLPLFSAARAFEFATVAGLAAYGAMRAANERGFADRLLVQVFRLLTVVVGALAALSVAQGGLDYERFSFRGTHPNTAAAMMLVVMLALAFHPQRARITRPVPWWVVVVALAPLVHATGSRVYTFAAVVALAAGGAMAGLRDKRVGALNLAVGASAVALVAHLASDQVVEFLRREQDEHGVRGLNGRLELWDWVLSNPVGSEVYGVGVGAVRGGLPVSWDPSNAHSAWIDILQTLGVLGLGVMGALVLAVALLALVRRSVQGTWMGVFLVVSSTTSVTISQPGAPLMVLTLCVIVLALPVADGAPHRTMTPSGARRTQPFASGAGPVDG